MPARSKARKRAVDIVFESDLRGTKPSDTLAAWRERSDPPVQDHAGRLVELVVTNGSIIDSALAERLIGWDWSRVSLVDRAILRVSVAELLFVDDVPDAVVIDEAVELAKSLSGDESPSFVNGVLARVISDKDELQQLATATAAALSDAQRAPGISVEDAPGDEPLGELPRSLVVDNSE